MGLAMRKHFLFPGRTITINVFATSSFSCSVTMTVEDNKLKKYGIKNELESEENKGFLTRNLELIHRV